jgi:hypothetical protein
MACIDFSGAFDSVKHDFIWKALERYNVGPQLIHYLKTLYFNAQSAVIYFGTKTGWYKLFRTFSKDANAMKTRNWEKVRDKAKRLFNAWSGRRLTIIGKANLIRAQIQPLIIFTRNTSSIPLDIEKQIITAQSEFL